MKKLIKKMAVGIFTLMVDVLERFSIGQFVFDNFMDLIINRTKSVERAGTKLVFSTPNDLTRTRVDSIWTKEPETIDWLDSMPEHSVLWDIGANIGLYTCYAAKKSNCRVFAFEPSVFNLEVLARNIHLNGLFDLVTIISILSNPVYLLGAYLSRMYTKLKGVFPAAIMISAMLMFTRK